MQEDKKNAIRMYNLKLSKYKLPQYFLRLEKMKTVNSVFLSKYLTFASYNENMPFMCIQNTYEKLLSLVLCTN